MSTIGADFTFATAGTEDTLYGFSYANLKSAALESADTDGFLISSALNGDLYYNTGSTLAPNYTKISDFASASGGVQVRITGVFVNNVKVSGSDPKLYWSPNNIDSSGNVTSAGAGANMASPPSINIFTVEAVDNVDGIFGNGNDTFSSVVGDGDAIAKVNLTAVNDAPSITTNGGAPVSVSIDENTTAVADIDAIDVDGDTLTYSLSGADAGLFSINPATGELTFNPAPNFEAPTDAGADGVYNVTVTATDDDASPLSDAIDYTVTVADVNETPVNTVPGGTQTADAGRQVSFAGNITVADPDAGTTLTTTLTVANGTLAATGAGVSGSGTNTVVITGSVVDVNAALATLVYTGDIGFSSDTLQVVSSDGSLSDTDNIDISAGFPQVLAVTAPADGYYSNEGTALMTFTVQFDQTVNVTGTPQIELDIGGATVYADYTAGDGSDTLTFQYTVLDGDTDADGIDIVALGLNGGTIKNGGGADADLDMTGLLPDTTGVLVDTDADVGNDMVVTIDDVDGYIDNAEKSAASFSTSGVDADATATVTFTSSGGGAPVVYMAAGPGDVAWTVDLSGLNDGTVTASITATDTAGNTDAGTSDTSVLDTTADVGGDLSVTINDVDSYISSSENTAVSYTVAGLDGDATSTVTFHSDGGGADVVTHVGNGTTTVDLSTLSDGNITATISADDTAGNSANGAGDTSMLDTTADAGGDLAITFDNTFANNADQTAVPFAVSGMDADVNAVIITFSDGVNPDVVLTEAEVAADGSFTVDLSSLDDGPIGVTIDVADVAGNAASGAGDSIQKDTTADVGADLAVTINDGDGFISALTGENTAVSYTVAGLDGDATSTVTFHSDGGGADIVTNVGNGATTVDLSTLADGNITVSISATDIAGNSANGAGDTSVLDTTADAAPTATVEIDGGDGYINIVENDATSPFTVSGLDGDVAVAFVTFSDGNVAHDQIVDVSAGDGAYTVDLTGMDDGTITATLEIADGAGNTATGTGDDIVLDTVAPTITTPASDITLDDSALKDGDTATLSVTFSEAVTGFGGADVTSPDVGLGAFSSGDDTTFTASVTPNAAVAGSTNSIDVDLTGVADMAGNPGVGSASSSNYTVDTVHPTIASFTSTTVNGLYAIGDTVNVTATTSEDIQAGATLDVTLDTGAVVTLTYDTATTLVGSYVIAEGQESLDLTVASFSAGTVNDTADATGNALTSTALPGTNIADGSDIEVDGVRPVLNSIVLSDSALKIGDTSTITFTFSEAVANFDASDVTVDAGSIGVVSTVDNITFTATFTPAVTTNDGSNVVTVGTDWNDDAGNAPTAGLDSANYTVDTVRPTVIVTLDDTTLNAYDTPTVTFTFSEEVQGFDASDVTVANGAIGAVSTLDNIVFTATLTPNASVEDATNVVTVGTGFADMADATGNAPAGSTDSGNYTIDTLIPAPIYTGAVYDAANDTMIISGSNIGTLMSFLGVVESYGDDIAANLDFSKLHWDVDGNGSNDYTADGNVDAAYVYDDHTLQVVFSAVTAAAIEANANYGSSAGSAWDNLVIENGFSKDSSGNIAVADGATLGVLGDLNQAGMPMVFETNFSDATDLVNETLGLDGVDSAAFDGGIDTLHVSGGSAADLTVAGDVVAGSSTSGSVMLMDTASGNAVSLTGGSLTGSLDGSVISFDDGSVLKTNTGAKGTLSGATGDDLLIAGANGDRLLGNAGDDMLIGGAGGDQIYGGTGNDTLFGGAGNDYLVGGNGADDFVFTGAAGGGNDTIADFVSGTDSLTFDSDVVTGLGDLTIADSGLDLLVTVDATGATIRLLGQATVDISGDLNFSAGSFYADGQDVFA
jgi:Ca2+-binding RTX toxin-like protein